MSQPACHGTNDHGEPCRSRILYPSEVDGVTTCRAHDPDPRVQAERETASLRGADSTRRRNAKIKGLLPDELPPLNSHDAAEMWTDIIGRAAATGRLSATAANAALRAVREFRENHEAGRMSARLDALTEALAEWRKTGDPAPVLRLVEGGKA